MLTTIENKGVYAVLLRYTIMLMYAPLEINYDSWLDSEPEAGLPALPLHAAPDLGALHGVAAGLPLHPPGPGLAAGPVARPALAPPAPLDQQTL